jgi:hypothetical protein
MIPRAVGLLFAIVIESYPVLCQTPCSGGFFAVVIPMTLVVSMDDDELTILFNVIF